MIKISNKAGWVILAVVLLLSMAAVGGFRLHQIEDTGQFGQVVKSQGGAGLVFADDAGDDQTLNFNSTSDIMTISGGNTVDLSSAGPITKNGNDADFDGERFEVQDNTVIVKKYPGNKFVGENLFNFAPSGTGYLLIKLPSNIPSSNVRLKMDVEGYGYDNGLRNFDASTSFLWLGSNKIFFQVSKEVGGVLEGSITPVLVDGVTPALLVGTSRNWSTYRYINVKRLYAEFEAGPIVDLMRGFTWEIRPTLAGVVAQIIGGLEDHSPFSSIGTSGSDPLTKFYTPVRCEQLVRITGYQIFKIAVPANNTVNAEFEINNYFITNNKVAKIHVNLLASVNGEGRKVNITGSFGSNQVKLSYDGTFMYFIFGDGTDFWASGSQMCMLWMVVRGNQAGSMSGVEADIYETTDLQGIGTVYDVIETINTGDQELSISGDQLTLSQSGGSVTIPSDNLGNHIATQNLIMGGNFIQRTAASDESIRLTSESVTFTGDFGGNYAVWLFSNHLDMPKLPNATNFANTDRGMKVFWKQNEVVDGEDRNRLYLHTEEDRPVNTSGDARTYKIVTEQDFVQRSSMRTADILRTSGSFDSQLRTDIPFAGTYKVYLHLVFRATIAGGGVGWAIVASNLVNANSYFTRQDQFSVTSDWTTINYLNAAGNVIDTNVALDYTGVMEFSAPTTVNITTGTNGVGHTTYAKGCHLTFTKIN